MEPLVLTVSTIDDSGWAWSVVCFRRSSNACCPPNVPIRHESYEFRGTCPDEWQASMVTYARPGA